MENTSLSVPNVVGNLIVWLFFEVFVQGMLILWTSSAAHILLLRHSSNGEPVRVLKKRYLVYVLPMNSNVASLPIFPKLVITLVRLGVAFPEWELIPPLYSSNRKELRTSLFQISHNLRVTLSTKEQGQYCKISPLPGARIWTRSLFENTAFSYQNSDSRAMQGLSWEIKRPLQRIFGLAKSFKNHERYQTESQCQVWRLVRPE